MEDRKIRYMKIKKMNLAISFLILFVILGLISFFTFFNCAITGFFWLDDVPLYSMMIFVISTIGIFFCVPIINTLRLTLNDKDEEYSTPAVSNRDEQKAQAEVRVSSNANRIGKELYELQIAFEEGQLTEEEYEKARNAIIEKYV